VSLSFPSFTWRRNGDGWLLLADNRRCVVPDTEHTGMWRVHWPDGCRSDLTNLTRARDALARFAESEERRQRSWAEEAFRRPPMRQSGAAGTRHRATGGAHA
jgi:hypothetical protein